MTPKDVREERSRSPSPEIETQESAINMDIEMAITQSLETVSSTDSGLMGRKVCLVLSILFLIDLVGKDTISIPSTSPYAFGDYLI